MLLDIFKVDQDWELKNLSKKDPKLIIDKIRGLIDDVAHPISDIHKTLRHFELEQLLYGNNKNKHRISFIKTLIYFGLIQNLHGITSDISRWNNIKSILDNYDMNIKCHYDERYKYVETAINFFHKHNYKIEIKKSRLNLEKKSECRFFNYVKDLIEKISHFGLHMTLCHLHEKYDIKIKRFIFDYPDFRADLKKEIPLGYLINVFLPYMTSYRYNYNKIPIKIQKKYKLLIECLMHYFILIDSIYNEPPFIQEFLDRGDVFDNILKHLIHEQLFSIYQLSDHALGKMLDLFPDNTKGKRLVKYLLDGNNECYNPICKIEIDKNIYLLDFDYNEQSMNVNYINPILHYEKNDRESKPMIFNKKDNVLYFLGSEFSLFNNISWYNFLKNNSNINDKKYGFIVEDFLCSLFDEKNINYIKGAKYNKSKLVNLNNLINKDGECDFIIDNDSYIFFIELKIKRLTSKSQGGDLYSLITDYCKSYLTSINQALNHEVILKYTGKLDLILEDGSHLGINLKNNNGCDRKVERVSLSLFEFNGLQDSRYFNNILSVFREVRFCNNDDKFDKEINSLIEKINNKVKFLNMNINDFMLSNRRISIPQVIELMKMSTNKDEFIHCLNKDRNVTLDSSNDWYRKIYFLRDLEKDQNYS